MRSGSPLSWLPTVIQVLFSHGDYGVNSFFVLSGFVIACSVRNRDWTPRYLALFAARRSLRLDPPYWLAIVGEIALTIVGLRIFPALHDSVPSLAQIAAHLLYLQDILGYGQITPIFWTLCFEFQFYLTLVVVLVLWKFAEKVFGHRTGRAVLSGAFVLLLLCSLAVHNGLLQAPRGIAIGRWHEFFVGAIAWWVASGTLPFIVLPAAWALVGGMARRPDAITGVTIVVLVSTICFTSVVRPAWDRHFRLRPLQSLGRISYSLYLFHGWVAWRTVALAQLVLGKSLSPGAGVLAITVAVGASIAVATVGSWVIERPALKLAHKVTLPTRSALLR